MVSDNMQIQLNDLTKDWFPVTDDNDIFITGLSTSFTGELYNPSLADAMVGNTEATKLAFFRADAGDTLMLYGYQTSGNTATIKGLAALTYTYLKILRIGI